MKRINARLIALSLLAIGLLLGTVALLSAYSESEEGAGSGTARHSDNPNDAPPRS